MEAESPLKSMPPQMLKISTGDIYRQDSQFIGKLVTPEGIRPQAAVFIMKDSDQTADPFQRNLALAGFTSLSYKASNPARKMSERSIARSHVYNIQEAVSALLRLAQVSDAEDIFIAAQGGNADTAAHMIEELHRLTSEGTSEELQALCRSTIKRIKGIGLFNPAAYSDATSRTISLDVGPFRPLDEPVKFPHVLSPNHTRTIDIFKHYVQFPIYVVLNEVLSEALPSREAGIINAFGELLQNHRIILAKAGDAENEVTSDNLFSANYTLSHIDFIDELLGTIAQEQRLRDQRK